MAAPRIQDVATTLLAARHEAVAEDELESSPPLLRLRLRPRLGAMAEERSGPWARLELELREDTEDGVVVRAWLDDHTADPSDEVALPPGRLRAGWLEALLLEFVSDVLGHS
jgi:hypothetical protein